MASHPNHQREVGANLDSHQQFAIERFESGGFLKAPHEAVATLEVPNVPGPHLLDRTADRHQPAKNQPVVSKVAYETQACGRQRHERR